MSELIKTLRFSYAVNERAICGEAADRIEALEKQNAELQSTLRKLIEQFEIPCRDERVLIQQAMKVLDK